MPINVLHRYFNKQAKTINTLYLCILYKHPEKFFVTCISAPFNNHKIWEWFTIWFSPFVFLPKKKRIQQLLRFICAIPARVSNIMYSQSRFQGESNTLNIECRCNVTKKFQKLQKSKNKLKFLKNCKRILD